MKILYTILFLLGAVILLPAQTATIQLLDRSSMMPIEGSTFEYADQKGVSDKQGQIVLQFIEGEILVLSHSNYGTWALPSPQVEAAIQRGQILREELWVNLQPVTIIALRAKSDEKQTLDLDYQDKMAHDAGAILSQTAGIGAIRKSGSYGFDPVLRGFKYDQLNVVINGAQCASAACPNRMDPPTSQIAPNMADRIEILKGPHSLRYGSSFGGTINVIPAAPRFTDKTDVYGRLSGQYESNGGIVRSEGLLGMRGKKYDAGLFASWSQGNDYKAGDGVTIPADFLRGSFGANLGLKLSSQQLLTLSATRNLARDADFPPFRWTFVRTTPGCSTPGTKSSSKRSGWNPGTLRCMAPSSTT
ncbi:MAG: TonB-dependent receptor plug domain-containing protein [Saprospirales bacterium]|nr:TonB-dependent receptor plug domain-containing protein [Saprospirales bacterium]